MSPRSGHWRLAALARRAATQYRPGFDRCANRRTAERLDELRVPPGNHLERLAGDRRGQYSIRINDQWRVCFRWAAGGAHDVEICDYH